MLLLEFSCCRLSSEHSAERTEYAYLVGVLLKEEVECAAFEIAARELWSRGFVVLKVGGISRCKQRDFRASDLLRGLWDQAESAGISVVITDVCARFDRSRIRGHAPIQGDASSKNVSAATSGKPISVDDHSLI